MEKSTKEKIESAISFYEKRIANFDKAIKDCARRKDYLNAYRYQTILDELKDIKAMLENIAG